MLQDSRSTISEIFRYRAILLTTVVVYPAWAYIIRMVEPQIESYNLVRLSIAVICLTAFTASFFINKNRVEFLKSSMQLCGVIAVIQASWLLCMLNAPYLEYCGYIILVGTLISIMPSKRSAALLAVSTLVYTLLLRHLNHNLQVHPDFIPIGMVITLIPSLLGTFTRLNHLEAVQKGNQQHTILFSNLSEGIISFDSTGTIESINPAALGLLQVGFADLKNLHSKHVRLFDLGYSAISSAQTIRNQSISVPNKDGTIRWLNVNATTFKLSKSDSRAVLTFSDITSVKDSQELIHQQQAQLFSKAKLSALGEMAAGIAHEINNPLAIISAKTEMIAREIELGTCRKTPDHLRKISETIDRIGKIVAGLRTFSRGGDNECFKMINLKSFITEVLSFCNERVYHDGIQVDIQIASDLVLECRPGQISQVLVNLIQNASDAMKNSSEKWIRIVATAADGSIQIKISDSGEGIKPEVQKRIMEPFFTTKGSEKGTGLGLSISRSIIQAHSGELSLLKESHPTTFSIQLPIHQTNQNVINLQNAA
jgi:signal transduction histidine kinase